jgi:hypothetical protein
MSSMFQGAASFTDDAGWWHTGAVTNMSNMFNGATAFDHSLGLWNISHLTDATGMLTGSGLSQANMDATVDGWYSQASTVQSNVRWDLTSNYTVDAAHHTEILALEQHGWQIYVNGALVV